MNLTLDEMKFWLTVFNAIGTVAVGAFVWLSRRNDDTSAKVGELNNRVTRIEATLEHLPTQTAFTQLRTDLASLQGETNTQTELLKRMDHQMRRINDWMLENK